MQGRWKKWAKRAGWGVPLAVLVLAGCALLFLMTSWGGQFARTRALSIVNDTLSGTLEVERLRFRGNGLQLYGVVLKDPDGEPVARIDEVDAWVSLLPLLHQHVEVTSLKLVHPVVTLRQDEEGMNLLRAVAARHPSAEPPRDTGPSALTIRARDVELQGGELSMTVPGPEDKDVHVELRALFAHLRGLYGGKAEMMTGALDLSALALRPLPRPVAIHARMQGTLENLVASVGLTLPGAETTLQAARHQGHLFAFISALRADPEAVRLFVPSYPLRVPLFLQAVANQEDTHIDLRLFGEAGHARLRSQLTGDWQKHVAEKVLLDAEALNLAELTGRGPATQLGISLAGHGRGDSLDTLEGALSVAVPASRVRTQTVGPLSIQARAHQGLFSVLSLDAALPGLSLHGSGEGRAQHAQFALKLIASDLASLGHTVSGLGGLPQLALSGNGLLEVTMNGPLRSPALHVQGGFRDLSLGETRVHALSLVVTLPSLQRPLDGTGQLAADAVQLGERRFEHVKLSLEREENNVALTLESAGEAPLTLTAHGRLDADARGLLLRQLSLRYPENQWDLLHPAHLELMGPRLKLEPLVLGSPASSGSQRIEVAAAQEDGGLSAHVQLVALDLARFPAWAVPSSLQLGGVVDADVRMKPGHSSPDIEGELRLLHGHFQQVRELSLEVTGTYRDDRAQGSLNAGLDGPLATATFSVPIQGVLRQRHQKLSMELQLPEQALEKLTCPPELTREQRQQRLCVWNAPRDLAGRVTGALAVSGFADDPHVLLQLAGDRLQLDKAGPMKLSLNLESVAPHGVHALLTGELPQGGFTGDVLLERSLGELRAEPLTVERMRSLPVRVLLEAHQLGLAQLDAAGLTPQPVQGQLTMGAHFAGPLLGLVGALDAQIQGLDMDGVPSPLNAQLSLKSERDALSLNLAAQHANASIVQLTARIAAGLHTLATPERLYGAALHVDGKLGPLSLQDTRRALANRRDLPHLRGTAAGTLKLDGTLETPRGALDLSVNQLAARKDQDLGDVQLHYDYADAAHHLRANLTSKGGGTLLLTGETRLPLSASALQKGLRVSGAPLQAKLTSSHFDLGFLSGVVSDLRSVSGVLDTDVHVDGTLGAPTGLGRIEWKNGGISLAGYGEYNAIHMLLSATEQQITLTELRAKSENGTLLLKAQGQRGQAQGAGSFHLTGSGELKKFPLVLEDQLFANLTLSTSFDSELSATLVNVKRLSIPNLTVELPDLKRKNLQPLDTPSDIVLLRNGVPVTADGRRRPTPLTAEQLKARKAAKASAPQRRYRVVLDAPRNLWVKSSDINVEMGLSDGFRLEMAREAEIYGQVNVIRGRVDVIGRRFDMNRASTVRFNGPAAQPTLNILAEYFNEKEDVHVHVHVEGQGKHFAIHMSSDPPLSDSEIYTLLATGRRTLMQNSAATVSGADQAASILGSVAAGELKKQLRDKLPLDVLSIEGGDSNYGLGGAKLEAGTYITDKLYVGYSGQLGADRNRGQNANAAQLDYQIGPRWGLEASFGDAYVGGADLIWTKDF